MEQSSKMTPKDFFLNLGIVACLYTSAVTFLVLMFEIIDRVFPDPLSFGYYTYGYYSAGIRFAIASLIIVLPLCIVLSVINNKQAILVPEKKNLAIRKWLSYLTLFLASLAMVIDLITLVNTYLGGEVGARFAWKVVSVFAVSALVFGYYMFDLRQSDFAGKGVKIFTWVVSVVVLVGIVSGFLIIGSPLTQRLRLFDEKRVSDLQSIQGQVVNFWQKKGKLPAKSVDLIDSISGYSVPVDPSSGADYEYAVISPNKFKLCATFSLSTNDVKNLDYETKGTYPRYYASDIAITPYGVQQDSWIHEKGRTCFDRTVDVDLYPVTKY